MHLHWLISFSVFSLTSVLFEPFSCKVEGCYFFSVDSQWVLVNRALWDQFVLDENLSLGIYKCGEASRPAQVYKRSFSSHE